MLILRLEPFSLSPGLGGTGGRNFMLKFGQTALKISDEVALMVARWQVALYVSFLQYRIVYLLSFKEIPWV